MRMVTVLTVVIPGSLVVVALGYAAAPWSICRQLEAAADAVTNKAAKGDRLDRARAPVAPDESSTALGR
jgi:hypothetical protein